MPTIEVNGTTLYYEEAGTGPALLFVHGMCGSARGWEGQVRRLSPYFRCVAYDRRGHSRSPLGQIEGRSVELHADDAAALIQALRMAPCLLVGSSGGARIGVDVVRRYAPLLAGAVLSEPPLFSLDPEGAAGLVQELRPRLEQAVATGGPRAAVDAFFGYVCPGLWEAIDEARRDLYRDNHRELFGDLQMPPYQLSAADLETIRVPCLSIRGSDSHPVLRRIAGILADGIPTAELVELAGSGHVTYAEQPEAFAQAVIQFGRRLGLLQPADPTEAVTRAA